MATKTYKAGPETKRMLVDLINKYHPELSIIQDEIIILFIEGDAKKTPDGKVVESKVGKVTPKLKVWTDGEFAFKFQIELSDVLWSQWEDKMREAVLNHCLCAMGVEENEETGEMKTFLKLPDVRFYREELDTTAEWFPMDDETYTAMEKMIESKLAAQSRPTMFVAPSGKKAPPRVDTAH